MTSQGEIVISDTTCLISLTRIGRLSLLKSLFGRVVVTKDIVGEYKEALPNWFDIRELSPEAERKKHEIRLDVGEASAIALAEDLGDCMLIIDEKNGRREVIRRKIKFMGTLGVLLLAKENGLLEEIKPLVYQLREVGYRINDKLIRETFDKAGEL